MTDDGPMPGTGAGAAGREPAGLGGSGSGGGPRSGDPGPGGFAPRGAEGRAVLCVRFLPPAPDARVLPALLRLLSEFTPVVAAEPPDAALADLTGAVRYFGRDAVDLAAVIRVRALARHGADCAIGVGPGPLTARVAALGAPPGATHVVPGTREGAAAFLAPHPVDVLPGAGPSAARTLREYGIDTVGRIATVPVGTVQRLIGARVGRDLHEKARGVDRAAVLPDAPASYGQARGGSPLLAAERSFPRDELDPVRHRRALLSLAGELGSLLRAEGLVGRTLTLTVRCADRTGRATVTRRRALPEPTAHSPALTATAYRMYEALGLQRARVRAIALRVEGLDAAGRAGRQLSLDPADDRARRVEEVGDRIRSRFGPGAVGPGSLAA